MAQVLSEEKDRDIINEWYRREVTMESLPAFMQELAGYGHDYGTICHAIAASAVQAARAFDRGLSGGITGFQAGCIMWEFISHWMRKENKPMRLVDYEDMLFPQMGRKFNTITSGTWEWLQKQAKQSLDEHNDAHTEVTDHWQSIVDGKIPFGYSVVED
jgi:hypothetical protein